MLFLLLAVALIAIMFSPKKYSGMFAIILVASLLPAIAFAQDLPVEALPPVWLGDVLGWIATIPKVGPVVVLVLKWLSVVVSVMTVLSATVQALLIIPEVTARWAGAHALADKIKKISDAVLPWLKWASVYNVQKKK